MPTSMEEGKWMTQNWLYDLKPSSVLDVGPGDGTYARRMRVATPPGCSWAAVEIYAPYVQRYGLHQYYDAVYVDDIREWSPESFEEEDVVLFGDVLEHMEKTEALYVLGAAKAHARAIMVSIPIIHAPQGMVEGNVHETHVYHWDFYEMLDAIGPCAYHHGEVLGIYWWEADAYGRDAKWADS